MTGKDETENRKCVDFCRPFPVVPWPCIADAAAAAAAACCCCLCFGIVLCSSSTSILSSPLPSPTPTHIPYPPFHPMVLAELGSKIAGALRSLATKTVIDQESLDALIKEITTALLKSDVNVKVVAQLKKNIKAKVDLEELGSGVNKRRVIQKAIFDELCAMLDPGAGTTHNGIAVLKAIHHPHPPPNALPRGEAICAQERPRKCGYVRGPAGQRQDNNVHKVTTPKLQPNSGIKFTTNIHS